jgi:hypothetical protein
MMLASIASQALRVKNAPASTSKRRRTAMKTETIGHRLPVRLLLIVTLATCAFAVAANAQSGFTGKFTLPYEVHWGTVVLPAGEYTISMDSLHTATLVQSGNNNQSFYTRIPLMEDSEKGAACLFITVQGNERMIRSLNLPQYGRSLVYKRLTKAEREQLAKAGQVHTVPVVVARE